MNIEPDWGKVAQALRRSAAQAMDYGWDQDSVNGISGRCAQLVLNGLADALEEAIQDPNKGLKPYR